MTAPRIIPSLFKKLHFSHSWSRIFEILVTGVGSVVRARGVPGGQDRQRSRKFPAVAKMQLEVEAGNIPGPAAAAGNN